MARDRQFWLTAAAVAGLVLFALFVRTYWNVEAATPGETFVLSESDAYFQHHTVERIQTSNWQHPIVEPLVNYPIGGINPNPPLWEWWIAFWGSALTPLFGGDAQNHEVACPASAEPSQATCVSTWWMTVFSPALFGALTVLVTILIGRELWGWRAGLFAGFLLATATAHIERSVFGFADHDAFLMFFLMLSILFFVKALNQAKENRWVAHWGEPQARSEGLRAFWQAHRLSMAYAAMSGLALAGLGLTWKGYAYLAGIYLVYGVVQVLVNHWRQRDSTHILGIVAMTLLVGVLVTLPYYANPALGAVFDTLLPLAFILVAWLLIGIVFTAARDLPFVLVLPVSLLVGIAALVVAFFALPSVAATLLGPLVYFKQTKLYTTIAEAHPADFNTVVFGTGLLGFFIALFALPYLLWVNRKMWRPAWTFTIVAGAISIYMMESAVRFMVNAAPIVALLGGWGLALIVGRLKFETIGRNLAGLGGLSGRSIRRSVNFLHVVGAVTLAIFLILPNVLLAVDAGMPSQYEDQLIRDELRAKNLPDNSETRSQTFVGQRMGAFGQGFIADYWRALFEWLSTRDTQEPEAERPAFLSWWDYGHWALSLGRHPAVADNFQNGFVYAGNFIASQNETHAVQLFIARAMDLAKQGKGPTRADFTGMFQQAGLSSSEAEGSYDALATYGYAPAMNATEANEALRLVEARTGVSIRYFAVDVRLFPFDNPQTRDIDFGSIFYAPVTLADKNPDDFVQAIIRARVPGETKQEFNTTEWLAIQKDVRKSAFIDPSSIFQVYKYKEPFFNSMFYRTYIGSPIGLGAIPVTGCARSPVNFPVEGDSLPGLALPGFCMEHFRVVYHSDQVRMLKYYPGAVLSGTISVDGKPLEGARVVAFDDAGDLLFPSAQNLLTPEFKDRFNATRGRPIGPRDFDVPHAEVTTDASGNYRLLLPFSQTSSVTVRAYKDNAEVGNLTLQVTEAQAEAGFAFPASQGTISTTSGTVTGRVFFDADRNRAFNAGDTALAGAEVMLDGDSASRVTTDAEGRFTVTQAAPGSHSVQAILADYEMAARPEESGVLVQPGQTATLDVPMVLTKAAVDGHVWRDADGDGQRADAEGATNVRVQAVPDFRVAGNTAALEGAVFSRDNGTVNLDLSPGTYILRGEQATAEGAAFGQVLNVAKGTATLDLPDNATMLRPATAATLNLTLLRDDGNSTAANGATVLFVPTSGGLVAAERTPTNGTLTARLVPGTYEVHAQLVEAGITYRLAAPRTITVVEGQPLTVAESLQLTRSG